MNKVILMGRLTRDPEVRYTQGNEPMAIARYTLAVDRRGRKDGGEATADFIQCVAFRNNAEFAEKYLRQGTKIVITGRIQTGSYNDREGRKVYTLPRLLLRRQSLRKARIKTATSRSLQPVLQVATVL